MKRQANEFNYRILAGMWAAISISICAGVVVQVRLEPVLGTVLSVVVAALVVIVLVCLILWRVL